MQIIIKKIEALSSRERGLLFLTMLTVIYFVWETLVFDNLEAAQRQKALEVASIAKIMPSLEKQMMEISKTMANNPSSGLSNRVEKLKDENITLEKNIDGVTKQLIPAEQMATLLGDIMAEDRDLKIIKIENIAEEPVFAQGEASSDNGNKNLNNLQVYRHGLVIEFNATYFATKKFLQALEALPWKLVLGELDYKVNEYPQATVRVVIYTLSLQKTWLGISSDRMYVSTKVS